MALLKAKLFIEKLLPHTAVGKLKIQIPGETKGYEGYANLIIISDNMDVLNALSNSINQHIEAKPKIWPWRGNEHHILLSPSSVNTLCARLNLPYQHKGICQELRENRAIISQDVDYNIDLNQRTPAVTFNTFKEAYEKQYRSEFFKNPWSAMKEKLENNEIKTMEEVEKYVKENPDSRSAKVLTRLKFGK